MGAFVRQEAGEKKDKKQGHENPIMTFKGFFNKKKSVPISNNCIF